MARIAVIDTGTNSTRLLVAEVIGKQVREVVRQTVITRLGQGVDINRRLTPAARQRVNDCMAGYAATIGELDVERVLIIATSSVRDAADGADFLEATAKNFSFDYRLLGGEEEALLSFSGATMGSAGDEKKMLFDVGGGSTEVVIGQGESIIFSVSMNLGCVRLKERFFHHDPVLAQELADTAAFIDAELERNIESGFIKRLEQTIAVAGTVTTLAALDLEMEIYDRDLIHSHVLTVAKVESLLEMLARLTNEQRSMIPVMEWGGADVIVSGSLIVSRLLRYTGVLEFSVSEYDILDGTALAMAQNRL